MLKDAGLIDAAWFTPDGCQRGTAVHAACHFLDEGDLDEETLDPALTGYVEAYKTFRRATVATEWAWIECPRQDLMSRYLGTPDRICVSRPRQLWDLKTGSHQPWHAIQAAAYVNMLDDPYAYRRFGVYLRADGKYSVREFPRAEYRHDLAVFNAALTLYYWKKENGQ